MEKVAVSILILTKNEEINLQRCLESVAFSDDIVVFDSYSTDETVAIAEKFGARVIQRKFDDWSTHQNWAAKNIDFKYPWVYYTDADEVVPEDLRSEIAAVVAVPDRSEVAFRVRRKDMFYGRWLAHSSTYPVWFARLFRPEKVRWERLVNPLTIVDGPEGRLNSHIIHYSFNKGLGEWVSKHNSYARFEAEESLKVLKKEKIHWGALLSRDAIVRRAELKALSVRLPLRPLFRFNYMFFVKRGFMDGWPGFTYCCLVSFYEYLIVLYMKEIRRRQNDLPI